MPFEKKRKEKKKRPIRGLNNTPINFYLFWNNNLCSAGYEFFYD
jgi:hypothetical protein